MALEIIKNIDVDFYDDKYILINAKQYDSGSRLIAVSCYNQGDQLNLSNNKHSAYVKYRKADKHAVLNYCRINQRGQILIELTEQMLAANGVCYVDLVVVNKGSAIVNIDTGEIITIDNSQILSTMAFCINVYESSIENPEIESSYEYDALNNLLEKAEADYAEIIQLSKSYAVGDAYGIRENEDFDNSKYYCEQAAISAANAKTSEENAKTSETNAKTSETNAKTSEANAKTSETNAKTSETNAKTSEENSSISETNAAISEQNSYDYSIISKRYAVGGTNSVEDEEVDNSKYYYGQIKSVYNGLDGSLSPKGTVSFEEFATAEKFTGAMYVMSESFVTDETFIDGEDVAYPAGTIVYYTVDGYWACFDGVKSDVATIEEVKSYLGI